MALRKKRTRADKLAEMNAWGDEPELPADAPSIEITKAYNWYNYASSVEKGKKFVLDWMKEQKYTKGDISAVSKATPSDIIGVGVSMCWNARMISKGVDIDPQSLQTKVGILIEKHKPKKKAKKVDHEPVRKLSPQEHIKGKAHTTTFDLEDALYEEPKEWDTYKWLQENEISGAVAGHMISRLQTIHEEIELAVTGKDKACVEAYSHIPKTRLKKLAIRFKSSVSDCTRMKDNAVKTRKPRSKKVKPAKSQTAKVQYKTEDAKYKIVSIDPSKVIGAMQVWMFNTKTRDLHVIYSQVPEGLSIKGTTIQGIDSEKSQVKKLRKPDPVIKRVLEGGKRVLNKVMNEVKTRSNKVTGRINKDTIILKALK